MRNNATPSNHFNLHVNGIGYLNRVRWVPVKSAGRKAASFLSCSISAMRGEAESVDYTYFDLKVVGEEAIKLIEKYGNNADNHEKVVISFKAGDIYPHTYEREVKDREGRKTGQREWTSLIKGRLLVVNTVTVNGERVYDRPQGDGEGQGDTAGQAEGGDAVGNGSSQTNSKDDQAPKAQDRVPLFTGVPRQPQTGGTAPQQNHRQPGKKPEYSNYRPQGRHEAVAA